MEPIIEGNYKKIIGYDEYYVTDAGDVYAVRDRHVGWRGVRKLSPKGRFSPKRYLQVCLSDATGKHYHQIHRLVAQHFCDGYFDGAVVNHIDGDIHNNKASNLEWVTQKENIHKSYVSSGVSQTRNYKHFELRDPENNLVGVFVGRNNAVRYVKSNNLDASASSLIRHGESRGYTLRPCGSLTAETVTTIP